MTETIVRYGETRVVLWQYQSHFKQHWKQ